MKQKKVRSAVPIYITAGAFMLYGLLFPLYTMRHITAALIVCALIYCLCLPFFPKKTILEEEKPEPVNTGDPEVDTVITQGRESVAHLRKLNDLIRDEYLTLQMARMEKACGQIFDTVAEHPERAGKIRKFLNYYLPTSLKLLESYKKLSEKGVEGENIRGTLDSIKNSMDMIATAFEKQADSLFADENMDITTDIEVLERVMKTEGLKE